MRFRFAANPTGDTAPVRVDREKRAIFGVSLLQAGEAEGHNLLIDSTMVEQCAAAVNATGDTGLKSRFTHPGMCSDGLGRQLGRLKNARVMGDKAVADLYLAEFAAKSPDGDLADYVMSMAEEDPTAFGLSIAFDGLMTWKVPGANGGPEAEVQSDSRPSNATTEKPFARISKLRAADAVDEPAANREGLFAAAFAATSNADAADIYAQLDAMRDGMGWSVDKANDFLRRYLTSRTPTGPAPTPKEATMDPKKFTELLDANPTFAAPLAKAFAAGKSEAEILGILIEAKLEAGKANREALAAKVTDLEKKFQTEQDEHAKTKTKLAKLSAIGTGPVDPGAIPAAAHADGAGALSDEALKAEWSSKTQAQRNEFCDSVDGFMFWRRNPQITSAAAAGDKE